MNTKDGSGKDSSGKTRQRKREHWKNLQNGRQNAINIRCK